MAEDCGVEILQRLDTELRADSAEWCPLPGLQTVLLCGTYLLVEQPDKAAEGDGAHSSGPQTREGQVRVYELVDAEDTPHLEHRHTVAVPGVLDIKWSGGQGEAGSVFGLVTGEGRLELWTLPDKEENFLSAPVTLAQHCLAPDSVALALDWSTALQGGGSQTVVASDSNGALSVFDVHQGLQLQQQWSAHSLEAWVCAFNYSNPAVLYSGGDDARFKGWDLRAGTETPSFTKKHDSGVCCIRNSIHLPHLLAVGGYDQTVELWDTRQMRGAVGGTAVGGGVWRVKWDPQASTHLLTASMFNGCHILDCSQPDLDPLPIFHHHQEHELGYGADWCHLPPAALTAATDSADSTRHQQHQALAATCSFYDHSLHLWRCRW